MNQYSKKAALTKQFMHGNNHNRLSLKMFKNGKKQTKWLFERSAIRGSVKSPHYPTTESTK